MHRNYYCLAPPHLLNGVTQIIIAFVFGNILSTSSSVKLVCKIHVYRYEDALKRTSVCNTYFTLFDMEKKKEESTEKEELTLQNVPKAVNYLINEIAEMRAVLEHIESQLGLGVDKHRPIDEERAAEILGQTKNVIKKMVRAREIPYYDKVRKVYFFEDELVKWVEESRVKTWSEEYKKNKRLY